MKKVVTLLLFVLCTWETYSQIQIPEQLEFIDNNKILEALSKSNLLIQQISQSDNDLVGTEQQMDFSNRVIIFQNGNNHNTRVVQTGSGNEALLFSDGGLTKTEVSQTGNNNSIFGILSNNTLQLYSAMLEQNGDRNKIKLALLGNNEITDVERVVSIKQSGNDLNFSGTYDSLDLPVRIDQNIPTIKLGDSSIELM